MIVVAMLCAVSVLSLTAIMRRHEVMLLVSVIGFVVTAMVIIQLAPELLMAAFTLAAAVAMFGLIRFLPMLVHSRSER